MLRATRTRTGSAYQAYLEARYALPLAEDLRAEVDAALAGSPWADAGIDTSAVKFSPREAGVIASALNHRLSTWPSETSRGPEAAVVRSLFIRFSDRALARS